MIINQKSQTAMSSAYLIYDVGSQIEVKNNYGISHLLEHLNFIDVEKFMDKYSEYGVVVNAYTGITQVVYYIEGLEQYVNHFVYDFVNNIANCNITEERFEHEKAIVMSEYSMSFNSKEEQTDLNFYRAFFNCYCPIGLDEDILNITFEEFNEFRNKFYSKPSKLIYTSQNYEIDESKLDFDFVDEKEYFDSINLLTEIQEPKDFEVEISQDYTDQDNCNLIIMTDKIIEEDFTKISFINRILAGGLNSPLYQRIREKEGLCYNLGLGLQQFNSLQAVNSFYVDCDYKDVDKVEELYFEEISKAKEYITEKKLNMLKNKMKINEEKALINLHSIPDYFCYTEINDTSYLDTLTVEELHGLVDKYYLDVDYIVTTDKDLYK